MHGNRRRQTDPYAHPHLPYAPMGIAPKRGENIKNVHYLFQGNTFKMKTCAFMLDGEEATQENSLIAFRLTDDRFCTTPIFEASWNDHVNKTEGGICVTIPKDVTKCLRRGGFLFSITVSDKLGDNCLTTEEGQILVEYGADAPDPDIAYRPDTDTTQNDASAEERPDCQQDSCGCEDA